MNPSVDHHPDHARLRAEHTPHAIRLRLAQGPTHSYLRDFIYGAIDGAVTTFAVVAGVAGAQLSAGIIIVLGLANLLADGFSMAVSNYLSTRAEEQRRDRLRNQEMAHILAHPAGEREEIRQIFAAKGFEGETLEHVVDVITADEERWVNTMLTDELGVPLETPCAIRAAGMTFIAFILVGAIPLAAFLAQYILDFEAELSRMFIWSSLLTGTAFFIVGAWKGKLVEQRWWMEGLKTLAMGSVAAILAYAVGALLHGIVDG